MSSRDIEGENPLLSAASKMLRPMRVLGPWITLHENLPAMDELLVDLKIHRKGEVVFDQQTSEQKWQGPLMTWSAWLGRDNTMPSGAFLMTGTGIVPSGDFTLQPDDVVHISIAGIGTLSNPIVPSELSGKTHAN